MNIVDVLEHQARIQPHAPAFVTAQRALGYAEVAERVRRMAAALRARGVAGGDRVAVRLPNTPDYLITVLALARLGAVGLPLHVGVRPAPMLSAFVQRFRPAAVIGLDAAKAVDGVPFIVADASLLQALPADAPVDGDLPGGDTPLCIAISSGTTGNPKAIEWSHRRALQQWERLQRLRPHGPGVRLLVLMGFDTNYAMMAGLRMLCSGGALVVVPRINLESMAVAIDQLGANHVLSSPALMAHVAETLPDDRQRFPGLLSLRLSGSSVPVSLRARLRRRLTSTVCVDYGSSEVGALSHGDSALLDQSPRSVGVVLPWVQAQAVDDAGQPLPAGQSGILRFQADGFPRAYLDDAQADAAVFRDGWFYPGDRGCIGADGTLSIDARVDELINLGGLKINPAEIEDFLLEDASIVDAAAYGVPLAGGRSMLLAAVVCRDGFDEATQLTRCRAGLGRKSPQRLIRLKELPRNAAGKVLRQQLAAKTQVTIKAPATAAPVADADV